jgi:hypothetical protein
MYPNKKTMLMLLCSLPLAACSSLKDHVEDVDFDDIGDTFNEQFEEIEFDEIDSFDDAQDLWENEEFQDRMDDFLDDLRD